MKITSITRSFSKTVQEKQFEPVNLYASITAELEEGEKVAEVSKKLSDMVVQEVGLTLSGKEYEKWTNPQAYVRKVAKSKEELGF